jgi:hypothetical protein
MEVKVCTGNAGKDYVALYAETLPECSDLVAAGLSQFVPSGTFTLHKGYVKGHDTVALHIYFGPDKPAALDPETRAAIDATP